LRCTITCSDDLAESIEGADVPDLRQTIEGLVRHRKIWDKLVHAAGARDPHRSSNPCHNNALKEVSDFGSNPGALRMFMFAPPGLASSSALVVVLHGCTQTAASYDLGAGWSTLASRHGFALLMPEQQPSNNPKTCFNWFQPQDATRDHGEALSIRQMIERATRDLGIDRSRVFVTGLSAGGAMTSVMLATYPEVFAGGAIIAGLPYGTATNVQEALESMFQGRVRSSAEWADLVRRASPHQGPWPKVSVWHGSVDAIVKTSNADEIIKQWTSLHGLSSVPTRHDSVNGHPRRVWCSAFGEEIIESFTVTGMGHGAPLAIGNAQDQCGNTGAFLLDVGISSSVQIVHFWGLAAHGDVAATETITLSLPREAPGATDNDVHIPGPKLASYRVGRGQGAEGKTVCYAAS
jgi:poly(hydroxyalkanoate) depolymerase family esterase